MFLKMGAGSIESLYLSALGWRFSTPALPPLLEYFFEWWLTLEPEHLGSNPGL